MRKLTLLTTLIFTVMFSSTSFGADRYVCQVSEKKICNEKECKSTKILGDDYRIIDIKAGTYSIGNDVFQLEGREVSGAFEIFKVGGAAYMKMNYLESSELTGMKRGEFVEVRDSFLTTFTSWGICRF